MFFEVLLLYIVQFCFSNLVKVFLNPFLPGLELHRQQNPLNLLLLIDPCQIFIDIPCHQLIIDSVPQHSGLVVGTASWIVHKTLIFWGSVILSETCLSQLSWHLWHIAWWFQSVLRLKACVCVLFGSHRTDVLISANGYGRFWNWFVHFIGDRCRSLLGVLLLDELLIRLDVAFFPQIVQLVLVNLLNIIISKLFEVISFQLSLFRSFLFSSELHSIAILIQKQLFTGLSTIAACLLVNWRFDWLVQKVILKEILSPFQGFYIEVKARCVFPFLLWMTVRIICSVIMGRLILVKLVFSHKLVFEPIVSLGYFLAKVDR